MPTATIYDLQRKIISTGASPITGAGTANRLAMFTGAAVIGDSNIVHGVSGNLLTVSAVLTNPRQLALPDADVTVTGGGTLALGGFTLTVPATGTAVLGTGAANTLSYWSGVNTQASLANAAGYLYNNGAGALSWSATATPAAHNLLDSTYHGDVLTDAVTDGDVIIGNATPKWSSLAISIPAANVRNVLGVDNGELRPSWKTALDANNPTTIAAGAAASPGTSLIFSHRDHTHGAPSTYPATAHNVFSATHGDTTGAASPVDGDIIIGNITPAWSKLAISIPAANVRNVLGVDNGELRPSWKTALDATNPTTISAGAAASPGTSLVFSHRDHTHGAPATWAATAHALLSATHSDTTASAVTRGDIITGQGASPTWDNLAISVPAATFMNYLGAANGDTEPGYKALFDANVPSTQASGDSASTGSATVAARRDHKHAMPGVGSTSAAGFAPTAVAPAANVLNVIGIANGETTWAVKTVLDSTNPTTISVGAAASPGTSLVFAHRDHTHGAPSTWTATAHNLLDGSVHGDTLADAVTDGDIIIGNATPRWSSLAISVPAANVRNVLGVDNGELRPSWKTALDATNPTTLTVSTAAAPGTSLVFSHRDHAHAITSSSNPGAAASLLASNASGYLQLVRLGVGTAPGVLLHALGTTEQLRLSYDASHYFYHLVQSGGGSDTYAIKHDAVAATGAQITIDTRAPSGQTAKSSLYAYGGAAASAVELGVYYLLGGAINAFVTGAGLAVGPTAAASSVTNGDLYVDTDVRIGAGLYVGSLGTDPAAGTITVSSTAPSLALTDTTASAKSLTIAVDANVANLRESAGASGSLLALDLANNRVGIGVSASLGVKLTVGRDLELDSYNDTVTRWGLIQGYDRATATVRPLWYSGTKHFIDGGYVGIGDNSPGDQLVVKQGSTTAAISVLQLNQLDVDQPFINFQGGTVYTGKTAADEYLTVKVGANTRYIRLYT